MNDKLIIGPLGSTDVKGWWDSIASDQKQALFIKYCSTLHHSNATNEEINYMFNEELKLKYENICNCQETS